MQSEILSTFGITVQENTNKFGYGSFQLFLLRFLLQHACSVNEDDGSVTCDVGNPLPENSEVSVELRLSIDNLESSLREMELVLQVNT